MGTIGIGIPLVILSALEVGAIYCQKFDTADVRCKVVKSRSAAELESSDCVDTGGGRAMESRYNMFPCLMMTTNFIDIADHATALVASPVTTFPRLVEADGDGVVGELGDGKNCPVGVFDI